MKLFKPALHVLSFVLLMLALLMMAPAVLALLTHSGNAAGFFTAIACTVILALLLRLCCAQQIEHINPREMLLITAVNWIAVSVCAALPFIFSKTHLSWCDAIFEAVSGVTTTGSTVLSGLKTLPAEILLWRSTTQWLGGLGIIGMAITILPFLRIGGMRLFQTESSDWSDKALPKTAELVKSILSIYLFMSFLCTVAYWLAGMSLFDAVNHMMTTISTGGYSTSDQSIGQFSEPWIQWTCIFFMIAGGMPFTLFILGWYKRKFLIFEDQQVRGYLLTLCITILTYGAYHWYDKGGDIFESFTASALNIVSVITTTGFAGEDYSLWGPVAVVLFFLLTFCGGCSGSTSGGVKIFRYQVLYRVVREQIYRAIHPKAVIATSFNGKTLNNDVLYSVASYFFLNCFCYGLLSVVLASCGLDTITVLSGSATALMNVGPGLGEVIGPAGNFSALPDVAKLALCGGMLLGRLEFLTIIVLFSPVFWRG